MPHHKNIFVRKTQQHKKYIAHHYVTSYVLSAFLSTGAQCQFSNSKILRVKVFLEYQLFVSFLGGF